MMKSIVPLMALVALAGCGGSHSSDANQSGPAAMSGGSAGGGSGTTISGAGATFPAPLYARWAQDYAPVSNGTQINYQAIGSGGGIKQIQAKTVAFGASDKPMKPEDLNAAGLYQFPTVIGGVVPIVNLPGVNAGQLKLSGDLLAQIFLGTVTKWNDPKIAALNAGVTLPSTPISVVHRSDGSGTTFLFTTYLSQKNGDWKAKVGASDSVEWPTGMGGKGNDGVAAFVKQTIGAIGYVEYAYAKQNGGTYALVQNQAGQFPAPGVDSFGAAATGADWTKAPGNYLLLLDQPGAGSWPISGATFIIIYKDQSDALTGGQVLKFFDWAYTNGDASATSLDYVPMPASVKAMVRQQWAQQITSGGKPIYTASK